MAAFDALILWSVAFVGSHFAMSHPLRGAMAGRLGERGFQTVYSLISLATFIMMVQSYRASPTTAPLWVAGDAVWLLATLLMLIASILFIGSFVGNPALAAPGASRAAAAPARGVLAVTRHPMMWSFALWAIVHILVVPTTASIILSLAILLLALGGARGQDAKKARLMGGAWQDWVRRTRFVPLSGQISGALAWRDAVPVPGVLVGGTLFWLVATWAHGGLGYLPAGLWRWLG